MTVCVEGDRLNVDMNEDELARLHAAARRLKGRGKVTRADMRRALSNAISVFCQRGCRNRAESTQARNRKR